MNKDKTVYYCLHARKPHLKHFLSVSGHKQGKLRKEIRTPLLSRRLAQLHIKLIKLIQTDTSRQDGSMGGTKRHETLEKFAGFHAR